MQASMAAGASHTGDRAQARVANRVSRSGGPYATGGSGGTQGASGSVTLLIPSPYIGGTRRQGGRQRAGEITALGLGDRLEAQPAGQPAELGGERRGRLVGVGGRTRRGSRASACSHAGCRQPCTATGSRTPASASSATARLNPATGSRK